MSSIMAPSAPFHCHNKPCQAMSRCQLKQQQSLEWITWLKKIVYVFSNTFIHSFHSMSSPNIPCNKGLFLPFHEWNRDTELCPCPLYCVLCLLFWLLFFLSMYFGCFEKKMSSMCVQNLASMSDTTMNVRSKIRCLTLVSKITD